MSTGIPNINGHQQKKAAQIGVKRTVKQNGATTARHISKTQLPPTTKLPSVTNSETTTKPKPILGAMMPPVNVPKAPTPVPEEKLQALRDWLATASDTDKLEVFESTCYLLDNVLIGSGDCFLVSRICYTECQQYCPVFCVPIFDELMNVAADKTLAIKDAKQHTFFGCVSFQTSITPQILQVLREIVIHPNDTSFRDTMMTVSKTALGPKAHEKYVVAPIQQNEFSEK
jgi:hypothetical protein